MRIVTSEGMRAADAHAIDVVGLPAMVLMENAGREVVAAMEEALDGVGGLSVVVLCGKGNNGGDGLVVARKLAAAGARVRAMLFAHPGDLSADCARQWGIVHAAGVPAIAVDEASWPGHRDSLEDADVVVDALLGTGFSGSLAGFLAEVVLDLNTLDVPVVAVDVPSGLSGDSAEVKGPAVECSLTVAFQAPKICHVFAPAHELCGELVVADIGIPEVSLREAESDLELVEDELIEELIEDLTDRPQDSHKGTWGHVVVVGGAVGRSGAPALAGLAALAAGSGLVTVATPAPCVETVAGHAPELMQVALAATAEGEVAQGVQPVDEILARATVLVIGTGLGTGQGARDLLADLLENASVPVVLDADALNLVAAHDDLLAPVDERPLVLTPHPGEFARLIGMEGARSPSQHARVPALVDLADRHQCVVVLKGFRTMVAASDEDVHVIGTGNPGMGTAGTGDVLAGIIGSLIGQGLTPWTAAIAGAHLHGRAGDLAERARGQASLRATDVIRWLPDAMRSVTASASEDGEA